MTPEKWGRIRELLGTALEAAPSQRPGILELGCGGDAELRAEVERMLAANQQPSWQSPATGILTPPPPAPGDTLDHYRIESRLGEGGMGVVYRAVDTRLGRSVALKFVKAQFGSRGQREARAIAALNHPNICTLYDVSPGYLVMELIEGPTLAERLGNGPLPLEEAVEIGRQIAAALAAAHEKGVLHRDLKPGNVMLTKSGVKVLDFGLAKIQHAHGEDQTQSMSGTGTIVGTPAYMSPEQAQGRPLDDRSDQFSLGAVFYEMLTGQSAFRDRSTVSTLAAVIYRDPEPLHEVVRGIPPELERIVSRCLRKRPEERYPSVTALMADLDACRARSARVASRRRFAIPVLLAAAALAFFGVRAWQRYSGTRWAATQALPEIASLVVDDNQSAAFALAVKAEPFLPNDPSLAKLWPVISQIVTVETIPDGAEVFRKDYETPGAPWQSLGRSPVKSVRLPRVLSRWKIVKPGYTTAEGSFRAGPGPAGASIRYLISLDREDQTPAGMVRVQTANFLLQDERQVGPPVVAARKLKDFWVDRSEVTNRQFKQFVDAGGYRKREYWKQPFADGGTPLSWEQAMARFVDATGRPGPAGWQQSDYAQGEADYPVGGVSWYEAAAYCEFAGKSLPTVAHWQFAAGIWNAALVVPASNFGGKGPAPVGTFAGLSTYGAYDMAGNVKEWCWNEAKPGQRYALGGGWDEGVYLFVDPDARATFDRAPNLGFRCVRYLASDEPGKTADPMPPTGRDYSQERPCSEDRFRTYTSFYAYDKTPLNATIEAVDQTGGYRAQRITFDAAYGKERVIAYLIEPPHVTAPLQAVLFFPSSNIIRERAVWPAYLRDVELLLKSGRAVMIPEYQGTFERHDDLLTDEPNRSALYRDHVIAWAKDLRRSIDYLETRPDIDAAKLAYMGSSLGARMGPLISALEDRIKANIWLNGGLKPQDMSPEVDPFHFAPRMKTPTLMLNGRLDFIYPERTAQNPMFQLLGTPAANKRHMVYDTAHGLPRHQKIKEVLDWLDRYLGPVK